MDNIWILAQNGQSGVTSEPLEEQGQTTTSTASEPNGVGSDIANKKNPMGQYNLLILGLMFVLMYFVLFRGPKKKQQQHKQMVQTLEKNDRVRTIGGIIGTVVDVKGDEITLKIDESNNTKMKVVSSAIGKNLSKE